MEIVCIKLGGSLITDKNKPYTTKPQLISQLVTELQKVCNENPHLHFILGNGAGSFAHQSAQKYNTYNGFSSPEGAFGACVVHADAQKLTSILIEECIKNQLPVYSLQPSAMMHTRNRLLIDAFWAVLNTLLKKKIIPFIYGDVMIDSNLGSTIYSTDILFRHIATYLHNQNHTVRIIHAGKYPGVLDINGNVIPNITPHTYGSIKDALTTSKYTDVTGGMKLKVEEMLALATNGISSHIIDGTIPGTIAKALSDSTIGTRIGPSNAA